MDRVYWLWKDKKGVIGITSFPIAAETEKRVRIYGYRTWIPKSYIGSKLPYRGRLYFQCEAHAKEYLQEFNLWEYTSKLLMRLKSDCDYWLGLGNRNDNNLWAKNPEQQIAKMEELFSLLPKAHQMAVGITWSEIQDYGVKMGVYPF